MKSRSSLLIITYTFVLISVVFSLENETVPCKKSSFKEDASNILQVLGYSSPCASLALDSCERQCKYDFRDAFRRTREAFEKAANNLKKAIEEYDTISSCLIPGSGLMRPLNCMNIFDKQSGIKTLYPYQCCPDEKVEVYCEQGVDGGGWEVIQRRTPLPVREDFFRSWANYTKGFGAMEGEFWLGLETIHKLTTQSETELRIDLEDAEGKKRFAKYSSFKVASEEEKFKLTIGGFSGDAGDSLAYHNERPFSTKDQSNSGECPVTYKGAWWYGSCHDSNLNGHPYVGKTKTYADGIVWDKWLGDHYSLAKVTMMIRPKI